MITASLIRRRRGVKNSSRGKSAAKRKDDDPSQRVKIVSSSLQKGMSRFFRLRNRSSSEVSQKLRAVQDDVSSGAGRGGTRERQETETSPPRTPDKGSTSELSCSLTHSPTPRDPDFSFESSIQMMIDESSSIDERDDDDDASTSTLMSKESEDALLLETLSEDEGSPPSYSGCTNDLERAIKRLEKREKTYARIVSGKPAAYKEMILANEMACREKTLGALGLKIPYVPPNDAASPDTPRTTTAAATTSSVNVSLLQQRFQRILLFEFHHSLEGVWKVLWYCVGHFSLFNCVDSLAMYTLRLSGINPHAFYGLLILFGLFIMRLNGYLWGWLRPESQRLVKFDMHNRAILGVWDARILSVFRKPPFSFLNPVLSMLSFYIVYIGCQFYYHSALGRWEGAFWAFEQRLEDQVIGVLPVPSETLPCDTFHFIEKPTLCDRLTYYFCTHYEGDPDESIIPTVAFYIVFGCVAAQMMIQSGGTLFEL
jgi:hypothetical protein